jgi:hypothetical protein
MPPPARASQTWRAGASCPKQSVSRSKAPTTGTHWPRKNLARDFCRSEGTDCGYQPSGLYDAKAHR